MSKKFVPTDEQRRNVEAMISFGIPHVDICKLIINAETGEPIDKKTLYLHFRHEIDTGSIKANTTVANSMYEMATKGEATSTKFSAAGFWLARRAGWKEISVHEHTGKDGEPIDVDIRTRIASRIARLAAETTEDEDPC